MNRFILPLFGLALVACTTTTEAPAEPVAPVVPEKPAVSPEDQALLDKAKTAFQPLPDEGPAGENQLTEARVDLGRMLYYETRLSKSQELSCNSCHKLDSYGVDNEPTSPGHKGQRGERNSPTVFNAALHISQFWDGRAPTVEEQAKGPVLAGVEMAMAGEDQVVGVLKTIPGYAEPFKAAFPGEEDPLTYHNMATAIGAFERNLLTPAPLDAFLKGDVNALTAAQKKGMQTYLDTGCQTCHMGVAVGGQSYMKLGLAKPWETEDVGRMKLTGNESDKYFFKVPSLRNIEKTGPYLHDGSVTDLSEMVKLMADHQLARELTDEQTADIVAFLGALTGEVDAKYTAKPVLPESGPDTPAPDPS